MARSIQAFIVLACTLLLAGLIITAGAVFTFERLADAIAAAPVKSAIRPSYVASLTRVEAADLDIAKSVPVAPAVKPVATKPLAPAFTHEVAVNSLWVRARPTKHSARVVALGRGARLSVIRTDGNWALVTGPNGAQGWVYAEYLRPAAPDAGQQASR